MLNPKLKTTLLQAGRTLGLFRAARWLTRGELRILCYHGIAAGDVAEFRPQLFLDLDTFERRLAFLEEHGFPVLGLEDALRRLEAGTLPPNAVVITIDDGFAETHRRAVRLLAARKLPATLYVTTYYAQKGTPVFRLLVEYAWWKARVPEFQLDRLGVPGLTGTAELGADRENDPTLWRIIEHGESALDEPGRQALASRLAEALRVDLRPVIEGRWLAMMSPAEVRSAAEAGIDIQLHTHRHRFPSDEALARRELAENRAILESLVGRRLRHLCYPSGEYSEHHFGWLAREGIVSATTCEPGFVRRGSHPLALARVFDGSLLSQLQFEAELSGAIELGRRARGLLRRLRSPSAPKGALAPVTELRAAPRATGVGTGS